MNKDWSKLPYGYPSLLKDTIDPRPSAVYALLVDLLRKKSWSAAEIAILRTAARHYPDLSDRNIQRQDEAWPKS